ncbi:helix-turn-helix transcriptional regulator [Natronosporangium hydrolyticum]|uniref:Helix-turn-helix transcriptional regulator n=1 Tax=Natronosporangium hydrolyticum TaxID=2811111 RepID=A0A895Y9Z8_9ACTN|nr:helix-turn-helix transcriptional regulator [Natronosporangium hydrolyticum]QSB14594.1 helix-turn-helix transcriptional regulator [Natronosporangium hydrolyticum]
MRLRELRVARGLSLRGLASKVPCKHPHISDMESGRRNPSQATAARLDKVLDAEGELIALAVAESSEQRDFAEPVATHKIVNRLGADPDQSLTRFAGAAWFGMLPTEVAEGELLGLSPVLASTPAKLEYPHVTALRSSISVFEQWDHQYGGGVVRAAMGGQFEWACRAARTASMTDDLRREWQSAAARLGDLLGWASFDAGEDDAARRYLLAALQLAGEAGDLQQRTHTATTMSRQLAYLRADEAALEIVDLARLSWRHLPPLGRCVIGIVEARALGRIGDRQGCQRAVGVCDEHFAVCTSASADDPAWSYYADEGQVLGDAGHALFDLAMATGDQLIGSATIDRLETAYTTHPLDAHRSRALTMIRIACLKARFGDPEEACSAAESGINDARQVSSRRITDDLRILDASLSEIPTTGETFDHVAKVRVDVRELASVGS